MPERDSEASRVRGAREMLMEDYSRHLSGQPHHHDASGRRRGLGEVSSLTPLEPCTCADPEPEPETKGYVVATDALERLERLVAVISEPLVAFTAELSGERDAAVERARQAEALNGRLTKALAYMVDQYPTTSWGGANDARDAAQGLLREIEQEGATMGSEPSPPADQETDTHGPTPHRDPDRSGD